jgi:predicted transcriptional regulator
VYPPPSFSTKDSRDGCKKKLKYTSRSWRTYCYYIQIWRNILFSKNLDVEKRKKKDPRCRKREKNKSTAAIILDVKRYKKIHLRSKIYY